LSVIAEGEVVLRLARLPSDRAFSNVTRLVLKYADVPDVQHWGLCGEAAAAAVATWRGLQQVEVRCGDNQQRNG
jgi:hypothetical protein